MKCTTCLKDFNVYPYNYSNIICISDKEERFQFYVSSDFLKVCPKPGEVPALDLYKKFNIFHYLHRDDGPALIDRELRIEEHHKEGYTKKVFEESECCSCISEKSSQSIESAKENWIEFSNRFEVGNVISWRLNRDERMTKVAREKMKLDTNMEYQIEKVDRDRFVYLTGFECGLGTEVINAGFRNVSRGE